MAETSMEKMNRPVKDFIDDLKKAVELGRHTVDWSDHYLDASKTLTIFNAIDSEFPNDLKTDVQGTVTIDLTDYRMGILEVSDLKAILTVIKRLPWLLVRFGYDIVAPHIIMALDQLGMKEEWGNRVQLDQPWRHPSNVMISRELKELKENSVDLKQNSVDLKQNSVDLENILQELKQLNASQLQNHEVFIQSSDDALKHEVADGIARYLGNSIIVAANYKWQSVKKGMPGDIDCLVTGFMMEDGVEKEQVVVLGEVKHNMQSRYTEAASQIRKNYQHWRELCNLQAAPSPGEEGYADYQALRINELKLHRVILAFGGSLFPKSIDDLIKDELENFIALQSLTPLQWLKVVPDSGTACLMTCLHSLRD